MSKKMKRIFAGALAFMMLLGLTAAAPAKETKADELALNTYLAYADGSWANQYWGEDPATLESGIAVTNATVTGAGSYTVGLDFTGTAAGHAEGLAFAGVIMAGAETAMPGAIITIDSVTVNGEAITIGKGYANNEDGAIRSNLYNEWVSNLPADARTANGDLTDVSPVMVSKDDFASVETVVVNFSVKFEAQAFLSYANGDWSLQYWGEDPATLTSGIKVTSPAITGEGTYTAALDFTGTPAGYSDGMSFSALMLDRGEIVYPGYVMTIDAVEINGEKVEVGKFYTCYDKDGSNQTRVNLYNEWVSEIHDNARRADGDLTDLTASPVAKDVFNGVETIAVTFTLAKGAAPADPTPTPTPVPVASVDKNGTYHAYFGIQTANYSFRNKWNDANYGINSEVFNQVTGWDAENNAIKRTATITDAEIKGNGNYSVSLTDFDFADGAESLNLLFISTDIPNNGEIKITDVRVKMDGKTVYKDFVEAYLDPDEKEYMVPLCINLWNADLQKGELFAYNMPTKSIELTFTVSGFDYDKAETAETAPTTAPAGDSVAPTTAPTTSDSAKESGSNTVIIVVIVVVVVVLAAVAVVVLKKKKK